MLTGWVLAFIASGLLTCATIVPAAVAETLPMAQVAMGIGIVASGCVYGAVLYTAMWRPLALISNDLKAGRPVVPRCVATKEAARLASALSIVSARSEALRLRRFLQEQPHHRSKPATAAAADIATPTLPYASPALVRHGSFTDEDDNNSIIVRPLPEEGDEEESETVGGTARSYSAHGTVIDGDGARATPAWVRQDRQAAQSPSLARDGVTPPPTNVSFYSCSPTPAERDA
jgi:hypothetical protein